MQIHVNGTCLWFDVEGPALVPERGQMRERPTVILLHGGPGGFDHSYFKPDFERLATVAQVIYLDLRDHGRSARGNPEDWSYEVCADDLRAFCDAMSITRLVVHGHSMGGFVALVYAVRHPGHAGALVLDSTSGRFDVPRMVEHFRHIAGDRIADVVARVYRGDPSVTAEEWAPCWKLFGRGLPERSLIVPNLELNRHYLPRLGQFDILDQLSRVECPTLVLLGSRDPAFTPETGAELVHALPAGLAKLEVIEGAGHFPWKDEPDRYWSILTPFVTNATVGATA